MGDVLEEGVAEHVPTTAAASMVAEDVPTAAGTSMVAELRKTLQATRKRKAELEISFTADAIGEMQIPTLTSWERDDTARPSARARHGFVSHAVWTPDTPFVTHESSSSTPGAAQMDVEGRARLDESSAGPFGADAVRAAVRSTRSALDEVEKAYENTSSQRSRASDGSTAASEAGVDEGRQRAPSQLERPPETSQVDASLHGTHLGGTQDHAGPSSWWPQTLSVDSRWPHASSR